MNKVGKVVDKNGNIIETVAYDADTKEILFYVLKENETLITDEGYAKYFKPKWNGEKWIETATEEEIAEHNKPPEPEEEPDKSPEHWEILR